jgi:hypothetical protein
MNRKIILLPLSFAAILALAACNPGTNSTTSEPASSTPTTSTPTTSTPTTTTSTPAVEETPAERHAKYATNSLTLEDLMTVQGKVTSITVYSGNESKDVCNITLQEGVYGYHINNMQASKVTLGKSYKIAAHGAKKTYPALNYGFNTSKGYTDISVSEVTAIAATQLTMGATGNVFADSQDASAKLAGETTVTAVASGAITVSDGTNSYVLSYLSNTVAGAAIATKVASVAVGQKITSAAGTWYADADTTKNNAGTLSLVSADDIVLGALPAATAVTVSGADSAQSVATGSTIATVTYTAASTPAGAKQEVTWSVKGADGTSATTAATIDAATGVLTPAYDLSADATVTVIATNVATPTVYGTKTVTILAVPVTHVSSITVTAAGNVTSVEMGSTLQLSVAVAPSEASSAVTWSSSNEGVATVNSDGLVTPVQDGPVTITATASDGSNVKGTIDLTVTNANLKTWTEIYTAVKDLDNSKASAEFMFKGVIVAWQDGTANTFLVSDGTNAVEVYNAAAANLYTGIAVGDYVEITSTFQHYYTLIETKTITSIVKAASTDKPAVPSAVATDAAAFDTLATDGTNYLAGKYISVSDAMLKANGSSESLVVNTAAGTGKVSAAKGFTLPDNGKWGTFKAWVVSANSSSKVLTIWVDGFTANDPVAATGVTISAAGDATTVMAGTTLQMSAVVAPTLSDQIVTWSVANKDTTVTDTLATIDASTGLLSGVKMGVVVVTATSTVTNTVSGTYEVTVTAALPSTKYSYDLTPKAATPVTDNSTAASPLTATVTGGPTLNFIATKNGSKSKTGVVTAYAYYFMAGASSAFAYNVTSAGKIAGVEVTVATGSASGALIDANFGDAAMATYVAPDSTSGNYHSFGYGDGGSSSAPIANTYLFTPAEQTHGFFQIVTGVKNIQVTSVVIYYNV